MIPGINLDGPLSSRLTKGGDLLALSVKRRDLPTIQSGGPGTRTLTVPCDPRFRPTDVISGQGVSVTYPKGSQVTASENHPSWRTRKGKLSGDIGGEFSTVKKVISGGNSPGSFFRRIGGCPTPGPNQTTISWTGLVWARGPVGLTFPSLSPSGNSAMDAWGAKAIANAKPTNALVDLSTTLGEMLGPGGIPRMAARVASWKDGVENLLKRGADDYLNFQFGLAPLTADIVSFANVVSRFNVLVKQYERDAGKVVRRKWNFEPIRTETVSTLAAGSGPSLPGANSAVLAAYTDDPQGRVILSRKTEVRRWFSGAFTYHLPVGYVSRNKVASLSSQAERILGLEPTPETLWNLAPWSWAVDWFSSAGDVVSNVSDWSTDGLVMRYGYLMEHASAIDTYYWSGSIKYNATPPSPVVVSHESKQRRRANPFGFGLTWGGLSPRQLAIAASLGISRW